MELRHIDPLRAANVIALVYGLLLGIFALVALAFILIATVIAPSNELGAAGPAVAVLIVLAYPVLGLVMGWISGLLSAAIYNFVVRWSGGLLFDLDEAPGGRTAAMPSSGQSGPY